MNIKSRREAHLMSADDVLLNLQGKWKCTHHSHFTLTIDEDTISVNEDSPQKIILERFDNTWSFYLNVFIVNTENTILSVKIERVILEVFERPLFGQKKFSFSTIYPANVKTFKEMDFHDNDIFRFELL